jgi:phosphoglycolate phosphatase
VSVHAIFDLDGTLIDSACVFADVVNIMLAQRGGAGRVTVEMARRTVSLGGPGMVTTLLGDRCGEAGAEIARFRELYAAIPTPRSSLYPEVEVGLRGLAEVGIRLSICSNKPQALCEKVLRDLELIDLFDSVVGFEVGEPAKPHSAPFDKALRLAGGVRRNSCLVGDDTADYELARNVGVPFVHAAYGYGPQAARFDGALRAENFEQVRQLVVRALSGGAMDRRERPAIGGAIRTRPVESGPPSQP